MVTVRQRQQPQARKEADLVIQGQARPSQTGSSWCGIRLGLKTGDFPRSPVVSRSNVGQREVRRPT